MNSFSPSSIDTILYDLDGTLADSFTPIRDSFNHMLRHFDLDTELSFKETMALVGGPLEESVSRLLPAPRVGEGTDVFRSHYQSIYLEQTRPMGGARKILERIEISGRLQAVVTNKLGTSARELIEHFGWKNFLPFCLGEGDGFCLKPSPEMIFAIASRMGVHPSGILFVGDSPFDFAASRAAGIPVCLLPTGTHGREELLSLSPDLLLDSLEELDRWFS